MAWGDGDKVAGASSGGWGAGDKVVGKVNGWIDAGKSFVSGVAEGWAPTADNLLEAGPLGAIHRAANLAGLMTGKSKVSDAVKPLAPVATEVADRAYAPQTGGGKFTHAIGQNTTALVAPGSVGVRMVNTIVPAVTGELGAEGAEAMGAGPRGQAVARFLASAGGAALASVRPQNTMRPESSPAGYVTARAPQDPAAMTARAQDYREVGMEPTLTDVVDDSGRGVIRAAGNRMTAGRQVANDFATARALDLPSRIGGQARRVMSDDPRTPDAIRQAMARTRSDNANVAFGAVRGDAVDLGQDGLQTLRIPEVVDAIGEAMRRERDPTVRGALEQLQAWAAGPHSSGAAPPVTIGMADRISRVLLSKAQSGGADPDLRATLSLFGNAIRNPAKDASPGYAKALEGYGADTRLHAAADTGENLMTRNTDEFVSQARLMTDPERELALAAGRRAIERRAGETIGSAPNIARTLADAPEQQARNAALMGPERASDLQRGMRLEAQAVDSARMVQPRAGSPTHLNDADATALAEKAGAVARMGRQAATHDWVGMGMDWLRARGMSDAEAEALVRLATDPSQTDAAIQAIAARRLGQSGAHDFMSLRNAATVGAVSAASSASAAPSQDRRRQ